MGFPPPTLILLGCVRRQPSRAHRDGSCRPSRLPNRHVPSKDPWFGEKRAGAGEGGAIGRRRRQRRRRRQSLAYLASRGAWARVARGAHPPGSRPPKGCAHEEVRHRSRQPRTTPTPLTSSPPPPSFYQAWIPPSRTSVNIAIAPKLRLPHLGQRPPLHRPHVGPAPPKVAPNLRLGLHIHARERLPRRVHSC